jgi:hypothetical protein
MDPKGAGSELQETHGAAPLLSHFLVLVLGWASLAPNRAAAAGAPDAAQSITYARDVAPLLDRWCVSCHGADEVEGGLRLDSFEAVLRGGDTGPAVIPADPKASLLVAKIERRHRPSMPPRRKLPASTVTRIRMWISAGAPP